MAKKESLEIEHLQKKIGEVKGIIAITTDITEKKRAEMALRRSEAQKRAILNGITSNIAFVNENLEILWLNKACGDSVNKSTEEMIGHKCHEFWADPQKPCKRCPTIKAFKTKKTEHTIIITPDGRVWDEKGEPVFDDVGNLIGVIEIAHDITERTQAEEALQKSRVSLANAQRIAHLGNWDWDIVKNELYWSDEIYRIANINKQEFGDSYEAFLNSVHPDDRNFVQKSVDDALYENQPYSIDHRILLPDGSMRFVHEQAEVTFDETGKAIRMSGTVQDITERKQMEQELRRFNEELEQIIRKRTKELKKSEEKYQLILNSLDDNIYVIGKDFNMTFANPALIKWLKKIGHEKDFIGKNIFKLFPFLQKDKVTDELRRVFKSGKMLITEDRVEIQGVIYFSETRKIPILVDNEVKNVIIIVRDITKKKKIEQKLKESEEKYRVLYEDAPNAYFSIGPDKTIKKCNNMALKLLGYDNEEMMKLTVFNLYADTPDGVTKARICFQRFLNGEQIQDEELQMKHKNGDPIWVSLSVNAVKDQEGNVIESRSVIINITERKEAEQKIKYQAMLVDNVSDAIISSDLDFNIISWNKAAESIYGWKAEEVIGKNVMETITVEYPYDDIDKVLKQFSEKGFWKGEVIQPRKDGKKINVLSSVSIIKDSTGNPIGVVALNRDITERKKAGKKLKESEERYRKAYEQANFFKDLFVHDMANILNALQMSADLHFKFHDKPEKINESNKLMGIFKSQLDNGTKLISNVRTLSKLEENKISLKEINVYNYIEEAKTFTLNNFPERNINIIVRIPDKNMVVHANDLLLEVFRNLLNNAVKYNDNPVIGIIINVSKEQKEGMNYMKLEFIDNGQGISNDRKPYIFKKGHEEYKGSKGMGIGLSLVTKIVESYEGKIWVEDKVKGDHTQGSNFIVLLLDRSKMI